MTATKRIVEQLAYRRHADQGARAPVHHPVIVVGAGPVGMALALDLASRGVKALVLDDADRIGEGSRGICWSKRTLEIFDRLGVAGPMIEKGVVWRPPPPTRSEQQPDPQETCRSCCSASKHRLY